MNILANALLLAATFFLSPTRALADDIYSTGEVAQLSHLETIFSNLLNAIIPLIGLISFVMIIFGGFTVLTSSGSAENTEKGKKIITSAVGGIILAIISWLTLLTVKEITGADVTTFEFGF